MNIADYLERPIQCSCGRTHSVSIKYVEIGATAVQKIPEILKKDGYNKPFILSDPNTYQVAGEKVVTLLEEHGINYVSKVLPEGQPVPNETTLGQILLDFDNDCDVVIGVGSGTINDISRFVSHLFGLEYYIVATAPSMDGYASTGAALIKDNLKTTFEAQMPKAIIADLDIISNAPSNMVAAGFGDVVGKYTCLADWRLSAIINDEYYCDYIVQMTKHSLEKTMALKNDIAKGDQPAIKELMEALVLAGIAMSYAGSSRPASGSEHHLSHFWEMRFLLEDKTPVLHGAKVGIATVLVAKLYEYLIAESLSPEIIEDITYPNMSGWQTEIERVFLDAAPGVIRLEEKACKNAKVEQQKRINSIASRWEEIREVLETLPTSKQIVELLTSVNAPTRPSEVGIDQQLVHEGLLYAKEVRSRYTILQLLWDLNLLSTYATRIVTECAL